ncbi:hypothetical protein [Clostridium beijerinckii]|uniref:hypothetical protein n=1 Tax=Clostridium beijerinckii TaxID=1520 RepID=UPI00149475BF|nr:hypothetical protein [Clostridium beijerinckii]NOV69195.1 hypothetical protein [Clostridium beijerinckii]
MVKWKRFVKINMIKELIRAREYLTLINFTYLSYTDKLIRKIKGKRENISITDIIDKNIIIDDRNGFWFYRKN